MNLKLTTSYTTIYHDIEIQYDFFNTESLDEKIARIIKNFEKTFGISFAIFESKYKDVMVNYPEKFI